MKKNRVVLDTNILISYFFGGNPKIIISLFKKGAFDILISQPALTELQNILARVIKNQIKIDVFMDFFLKKVIFVNPTLQISVIQDDPSDNKFLECAVAGRADFIVSGDKHLLKLRSFQNIPILNPRQFLDGFSK